MAFDPNQPFEEVEEVGFDPNLPFELVEEPVGTSVEQEVSQLGAALKSGIAQPLQAMGVTAETLGMPEAGAALKGAVEQPEGYVPAAQRFMEPQAGEAQLGGFAFQYLPRAIVEQVGQLGGSIVSRAAGGIIGGAAGSVVPGAGTAVGAGIGMFTGPALFEAAQIVGPVAQERAKNNGREIPNSEDLAYAWTTAGTSGALNAIGTKYLPGGEKAVGALTKRIAASFLGESATEGAQALAQQTGETILTEKGLEIQPKAALGEALIGGVSAGGATILMSPLQKEQVDIDKEADLESRDLSVPVDDPEVRANLDKVNILEQENKDSLAIINKFGVESKEGKAAQQTIVDNTDEINKIKKILPPSVSLTINEAEKDQIDKAAQMMSVSTEIDNLKEEIDNDEMGLQAFETGTPERQQADMALKAKKDNLAQLEGQFAKLSAAPAKEAAPTEAAPENKEQINTRIEELNKEFDALDENDTAGQDRVNKAIFAEQNKLAEMTAIEQGVEPQATTPTREMGLPPSGRRTPFGTFYPDRPVLQAFVKATDKAIKGIRVAGKRAQKLKNAIRTNIARNAGFLAGINAEVISSEDYGKLTGKKQVVADSGTYRAAFFNGKKYLVLPDVNQLTATTIKGEQRAASKDAALDQESRAADKKLEEEMIHLSMYQALQDEYAGLKKPKQTEQQYIVSRIGQIAQEVKRTNPNAVPGVSEAYLNQKGTLDDVGFSMEFMRMVIQRVRTGQITEDLNAIRKAEAEAFSDESRGTIIALKNSILNALKFVRNSLARYLGKGTSTREVKRMEDSINNILDEYGIVKGEANYEFKDYSAAQPKGEVSLTITPTEEAAPTAEAITPSAAEVAPATTTQTLPSIPQAMGALRAGTIEGLYTMLFDKLKAGDTTELGKPSRVLIDAMPAFKSGIIKNPSDLKNWVNGDAKMREDLQKIQAAQAKQVAPATEAPIVTEIYEPIEGGRFRSSTPPPENATNVMKVSVLGGKPYWTFRLPKEPSGAIVARAAYVQDFQVFDKNRENPIDDKIIVEVDSPAEVDQAVKNTEKYREWLRKSRAKKLKFFTVGAPRLYRRPGESGISARAGVTPKVVSEQRRITDKMIGEIESAIESIKPKRSRAGKEYVSRTTQKGKKYPSSLVSPYSAVVNLYTSDTATESLNAIKKIMQKNPNLDFLTMVTNIANQTENYGLNITEQANITAILLKLMPTFHQEVMESDSLKDRENIALNGLDIQYNLAQSVVNLAQAASRILNGAKMIRNIGNAGTAVAAYKKRVIDSLVGLQSILKYDFNEVANAVRGDRRKAVDNVFTLKEVLSKITQLKKKAERNPQAAVDSIRKMISRKKTRGTREIVLEFCASMFDTKGEKYSNMVVDETAKAIMSLGADKKEFSPDNVYKYIYQAFGAVAKQTAKELGAKEVPVTPKEAKKREGKYLAQVKSVIGNDKAYKQFIAELKTKIGSLYQDKAQFENDYKELFSMLGDRQWSEAMRNQAIKDSADFLDYKFNDLITYIGENRSAAQSAVKAHIRAELSNIGATNEQIDKFVDDVQTYLDNETAKKVKKSLGFEISKETGRIIGGTIEKEAMKKVATAEDRFQLAKTLKGLTKLAATDQRAFLDKLNELIITELGFDDATSNELSKYIEEQMAKAIQAQKSENLQSAIDRAQETLTNNGIKKKANQRTIIQRLIEMANMGQLDEFGVYEAFRQTHDFGKGYLEWNPNLAQQLREWGDRISALPEGVTRSIEEQKLGRFMLENQVFSAKDYFGSYWYFALLSSVGTQAMNFLGGAFNLIGNMAVWSIYTKGKSTGPMLRALYNSTIRSEAPARNAFAYVMQTGLNPSGIQDQQMGKYPKVNVFEGANPKNTPKWIYNIITFGDGKINSAPDWVNNTLKNVSPKQFMRLMRAVDALLRETTYEVRAASLGAAPFQKNAYNLAKEQAIRELASSKSKGKEKEREIIIRANEIYSQQRLSQEKRSMAEQDALETIFGQEPQGLIGVLANTANSLLAKYSRAKYFIPFTNVVANVLNNFLNYNPLNALDRLRGNIQLSPLLKGKIKLTQKGMNADFIKGREDKAAEIAIKGMIGFAATLLPIIVSALQEGEGEDKETRKYIQFYDAGPTDPEQNKIWRDNGGIPYSLRIGDQYISFLYTPLVIPLASGAKVQQWFDQQEKKEKKTPVDIVEKAATLFLAPLGVGFVAALEQSFLTGAGDLLDLRNSQNIPKDTFRIATNIVSRMLVPGVLRDFQKMVVDERVEGDNVASNLLKEMPGSSAFLDKSVGYFGDPARYNSIIEENGIGRRAFSLLGRIASSETPDPAFQIMYRNALTPPKWQGSLQWSNQVRMTKAEQREFVSIAGPLMKEWIIDNEDTLNELPTDEAQEFLSNNIGSIRRAVKADLEFEKGIEVDLE